MQTAYVNGIRRTVPENWNDIKQNRKLLLWTVNLFFDKHTKQQLLNLIAYKFLKIGAVKQKRVESLLKNHPDSDEALSVAGNLFRASEAFSFVTDKDLEVKENIIPELFRFRKLHAPMSVLSYCGIWEYALAEDAFFQFAEKNKPEDLDRLIAILYRRKKMFWYFRKSLKNSDGDKRVSFNENTIDQRTERISKLSSAEKWLIYRWFSHQREIIIDAHPYTFKKTKGESSGGTWADTVLAMSSVGDEDKTAGTKLAIILRRIDNENKAADEFKRKNNIKDD